MSRTVPNVIIMSLDEAEKMLYNEGINFKVIHTHPGGEVRGEGELRVIRQREISDCLHELVVSRERYTNC